ncbi:MAG: TonB-dependent receptor plug domain-containing protein, partial [Gammaproteobacteria bacterium]|nr:TonB-dependent receptor plug domain-containing protein [Gammaproteobacteria bacterium]
MSGTQFRCKPLSFAVRCAVIGMVPFFSVAQDDSAVKKVDDQEIEKIEVIGMRGSAITSQELKRQANTVKDVISADDIGALPDKSVTEALMRVPGVTIERFASSEDPNHFAAEGTGVVVRGLDRVRSEINGRDAFSASTGGGLSYEDIPGELLGHIEVVKNQTADLIAGGVAGTVNLVTRKPFDSEGFFGTASIKGSYGDHREEWTPIGSAVISNRWTSAIGDFGVLLAASSSNYKDRGDGVALGNYYERSATAREMPQFGNYGTELPNYKGQTKFVPADASIRSSESERDRRGLASSLQFRNTDNTLEIVAEFISSKAGLSWD